MTPALRAALFAVAETRFCQPAGDDAALAELRALGYIQPLQQGKLHGYGLARAGTVFIRQHMGYER